MEEEESKDGWWSRQAKKASRSRHFLDQARRAEIDPTVGSHKGSAIKRITVPWVGQPPLHDIATLSAAWFVTHVTGLHASRGWRWLFLPVGLLWFVVACVQYLYRIQPLYDAVKAITWIGAAAAAIKFLFFTPWTTGPGG